jgi:hypothetical protein
MATGAGQGQGRVGEMFGYVCRSFMDELKLNYYDTTEEFRDVLDALARDASVQLSAEGREFDEAALDLVGLRLRWLLATTAVIAANPSGSTQIEEALSTQIEEALHTTPPDDVQAQVILSADVMRSIVSGLCPGFWPFC